MITCYTCQNKTSKRETKKIKISNLTYLMCEDCFKTYEIARGSEVLKVVKNH